MGFGLRFPIFGHAWCSYVGQAFSCWQFLIHNTWKHYISSAILMPNLLICPDLFVIGYSHQYNLFPGIRGYHLQINVISTWCHLQCQLCTVGTLRGLKLFLRVHPVLHGPFLMFHLLQPHTVDTSIVVTNWDSHDLFCLKPCW